MKRIEISRFSWVQLDAESFELFLRYLCNSCMYKVAQLWHKRKVADHNLFFLTICRMQLQITYIISKRLCIEDNITAL